MVRKGRKCRSSNRTRVEAMNKEANTKTMEPVDDPEREMEESAMASWMSVLTVD